MIPLVKKILVTNHSIIAIFDSETRDEEHVTKISLTKKQFYCSCEDFLFRNNLQMMMEGRVYKCKHITFLEYLLINPNLLKKLVQLKKMSYDDYKRLIERLQNLYRISITNI